MERTNSFLETISKEDIETLPVKHFEGTITVIDSEQHLNGIVDELKQAEVIGFDTETRPSFKKGRRNNVALLQLATDTNAYLFRINKMGLPLGIAEILQDPSVYKVGVAISDDIKGLQRYKRFNPGGFIELQQYVNAFNIIDNGLRKLVANILKFRISKSQQTSNWENPMLTEQQCIYAATDAWVCYQIYQELQNHI
ncbi:MAG: 3'-5' exonuclease [Bacteroidota bacterium]